MTDPPPTARKESAPASFAAAAHSSTTCVDESCGTPSKIPVEAAVLDTGLHLVDQAGAADDLVGDDEDAVRALLHELEAGALDQAAARDDPGVVDVLVEVLEARHLTSVQRRRLGAHFASSRSCRPAPSSIVR
jgi:hypothetical protein